MWNVLSLHQRQKHTLTLQQGVRPLLTPLSHWERVLPPLACPLCVRCALTSPARDFIYFSSDVCPKGKRTSHVRHKSTLQSSRAHTKYPVPHVRTKLPHQLAYFMKNTSRNLNVVMLPYWRRCAPCWGALQLHVRLHLSFSMAFLPLWVSQPHRSVMCHTGHAPRSFSAPSVLRTFLYSVPLGSVSARSGLLFLRGNQVHHSLLLHLRFPWTILQPHLFTLDSIIITPLGTYFQ